LKFLTYRSVNLSMGTDRTDGERTRQRILRAALRCFAERGYAGTAMGDIARAARVSKPALYYHFRDKAALFRALLTGAHELRRRRLEEALASAADLRTRLVAAMRTWFDSFEENRQWLQLGMATTFAAPGEVPAECDGRDLCRRNFEVVCAALAEAQRREELTKALSARELTHAFFGLAHTFLAASLIFDEEPPGADLPERLVDLFLGGAGVRSPRRAVAAGSRGPGAGTGNGLEQRS
jgi:AcrR family transcriptional regulator